MLFKGGKKGQQFIPDFGFAQKRVNELFAMGMKQNPYAEAALMEIDMRFDEVATFTYEAIRSAKLCLVVVEVKGMSVSILTNITAADVYYGRDKSVLDRRERIKLKTLAM